MKENLLIIENSVDVTGALKSITRTAYDLREYYNFQFLIPKNSKGRAWIERNGIYTIFELPMKEISRRFTSLLLYFPYLFINAFRLNRILKENSIHLIHLNDLYNLMPVAIRLCGNSTPYVCHIRFLPNRFPKFLFDFWLGLHLKYASKIIVVSQAVLKQLPLNKKIVMIHNELPIEEGYPQLPDYSAIKSNFTFLYLSNFIAGKGQNFALESFARIHHKLPDWKLRFVGSDMGLIKNKAYREGLIARAKVLCVLDKTEWVGFTEDVEWEYKHADIALNFSESESFSITCLESLYFGCPVIATDCGGPVEIIDHKESGLIVPNRSIEIMAQAMLQLAEQRDLRIKMGKMGRVRVRDKFSVEKTSYKLKEIYHSMV